MLTSELGIDNVPLSTRLVCASMAARAQYGKSAEVAWNEGNSFFTSVRCRVEDVEIV
jgi:hypothetical protein